MKKDKIQLFLNTVFWGFLLWLFGYILGFIFFAFVSKDLIGWYIMPFGLTATIWVLLKKIKRESFQCYTIVGIFWTLIAIILDYFFLVRLLKSTNYYKLDVYIYYVTILVLPALVGFYKLNKTNNLHYKKF
jgi:hypothetical protein